jgi:RimJ/RimL family protein N-acetyltransferase
LRAVINNLHPGRPLAGRDIRLEPLDVSHIPGLTDAASDPAIWRHTSFGKTPEAYFSAALDAEARGEQVPFAVRRIRDRRLVGMSRLFEIDEDHKRCEIGYTWYIPEEWGTRTNPESKLLLLTHCFESWGARRVQFKTDHENLRSQAAIAKLGAVKEGVLRAHIIRPNGSRRDSVIYSITHDEWPKVKAGLRKRLSTPSS